MDAPKNKPSSLASTIRWVARILCILGIVFIGLWAIEATEGKVGLGQQILGFLMAPPFLMSVLLIIILITAWKRELVGGILIALIGLATAAYDIGNYHRLLHRTSALARPGAGFLIVRQALTFFVMISLPLIIVGVLFVISYYLHRSKKLTAQTP